MRKVLLSLLVLALACPAFAATTLDVAGGEEVLTVTITVTGESVVRGLALNVVSDGVGDMAIALVGADFDVDASAFNTFIDFAYDVGAAYEIEDGHPIAKIGEAGAIVPAAGVQDFAVSAGYLDDTEPYEQKGLEAGVYTITINMAGTADTDFTVSLDTLRGGIVGEELDVVNNLGTVTVTAAGDPFPSCQDFNLTKKVQGGADNIVNVLDINAFINYVNNNKIGPFFTIPSSNPAFNANYDFDQNGTINVLDLNMMINFVNDNKVGPFFSVTCP